MAALYGRMQGGRGQVTRTGHDSIRAQLETWDGSIATELDRDGSFRVTIGPKTGGPRVVVAQGNVNDRTALDADDVHEAVTL